MTLVGYLPAIGWRHPSPNPPEEAPAESRSAPQATRSAQPVRLGFGKAGSRLWVITGAESPARSSLVDESSIVNVCVPGVEPAALGQNPPGLLCRRTDCPREQASPMFSSGSPRPPLT